MEEKNDFDKSDLDLTYPKYDNQNLSLVTYCLEETGSKCRMVVKVDLLADWKLILN